MYKLIAIDLDGTLLNDDKKISKDNLNTINKAIELGYEVVIATGRRYWSAKDLSQDIAKHITIIANNGNIVRNSINDETIISKYMDINDFNRIVEAGKKRNLDPIIHVDEYTNGYDVVIEPPKENKGYYEYVLGSNRYKVVEDYREVKKNVLAVVYPGDLKLLHDFYLDILDKYPGAYNAHIMENMIMSEALLEVMNPDGTKWSSILEYAKTMDIKAEEIIAIGDNNNDISMIRSAGLGIAMNNGSETIKDTADLISARNNNESGVAFELKRVLDI